MFLWLNKEGEAVYEAKPNGDVQGNEGQDEGSPPSEKDQSDGNYPSNIPKLKETHLRMLLNSLDIEKLVAVADQFPEFVNIIAKELMINKYHLHEKPIYIDGGLPSISDANEENVIVTGIELIQKMLKNFGFLLTNLHVNGNHFDQNQTVEIYKSINDHCWEQLKSVEVNKVFINPFREWSNLFGAVTDLTMRNIETTDDLKINETFENLRNLEIYVYNTDNLAFIAFKFPNLAHFKLRSHQILRESSYLTTFFEENTQLLSLDLGSFENFRFLRSIQEKLTNLEKLTLLSPPRDFFTPENCAETLHFSNIQEFALTINPREHLTPECIPFTFETLKKVEIITPELSQQWMEFIQQFKGLNHISLPETVLSFDQLKMIVDVFPEIKEIELQWSIRQIGIQPREGIIKFMLESTKVKRITIWSDEYTDCRGAFRGMIEKWIPNEPKVIGKRRVVSFAREQNN